MTMLTDVLSDSSTEVDVIEIPRSTYKSLGLRGGASDSDGSNGALTAYKKTADPSWRSPFNPDWDPSVAEDSEVGFPNDKSRCFRNVTFQMLLHLPVFLSWLKWYRQHHIPDGERCSLGGDRMECKPCLFYNLAEGYWDSSEFDYLEEMNALWGRVFSDWDAGNHEGQQDSTEFFSALLNQLREETRGLFKSDLDDMFCIPTVTYRRCLQPSSCPLGYGQDKLNFLSVELPGEADKPEPIQNMINAFFKERVISNGGCSTCKQQRATREYLGHPPEVLLVHVNRVVYENGQVKKIMRPVSFQEKMTLDKELFDPRLKADKNIEYELSSIQLHSGAGPQMGHYRILAKGRSGRWTLLDDDQDRADGTFAEMAGVDGVRREAYVFAYRRLPVKPPAPAPKKTTSAKAWQVKPADKPATGGGTNKLMTVDMNAVQRRISREKSTQPDVSTEIIIQQQAYLDKSDLEKAALVEMVKNLSKEKAELERKLAEKEAQLALTTSSVTAGDASDPLKGTMALVFKTADGKVALDLSMDGMIRRLQSLPLRPKKGKKAGVNDKDKPMELADPDMPMKSIEFDEPTESTTGKKGKQGRKSTTKSPGAKNKTTKDVTKKRKIGKEVEGPGGDKRRKTG